MYKLLTLVPFLIALISCGASEDSPAPLPDQLSNVTGSYTFTTSSFSATCTDGSSGSIPPIAINFTVTHTGNQIELVNDSIGAGGIAGITILNQTTPLGNIASDNTFVVNSNATATFDGIPGEVTLNYSASGTFTETGWSGTYYFSAFIQSYGVTCNYQATFSGTKSTSKSATTSTRSKVYSDNYLEMIFNIADQL